LDEHAAMVEYAACASFQVFQRCITALEVFAVAASSERVPLRDPLRGCNRSTDRYLPKFRGLRSDGPRTPGYERDPEFPAILRATGNQRERRDVHSRPLPSHSTFRPRFPE
jgi:hypothetical protein